MKSRPTCIHLKTKVLQAPAIAVALALILGINTQAFGQAPGPGVGSNFEIDGNLHSESSILDDWLAGAGGGVLNSAGIPFDSTLTFHVIDLTGNSDLDVFAQSDKVFHDPNTYNWKTGSVPQKDDINNGLFHLRFAGNGDLWGIMSGDRRAVNGDSYIDFELLQNSLFKNTDGSFTSLGPDGGRTIGDILLTIEFTRGGSAASFFVQFWDSIPGTNPLEFTYFDTTVSANQAFVSANTDSSVSVPYGAFGSTLYQVNAFGEAAINISQVIPSADSCFGIATIFIRTKSSQSTTAQLKDMIEPIQLNLCLDNTPPQLVGCPTNLTIECSDAVPGPANVTATDNCDDTPVVVFSQDSIPGACAAEYTLNRKWVATDVCGNSDSCTQTITVQDTTPPVISCPADTTFECNIGGNSGTATATDNCDPNPGITSSDSVATGVCEGDSTIYRTWIATDDCGNADTCLQIITYVDTTPPVISCPADTVFNCVIGNSGTATATDNCDSNPSVSFTDDTTSARCPLSITRTWVAVDCSGNADTCVQSITVQDIEAPVISCPADTVFNCVMGNAGVATATDNCDPNPTITSSDSVVTGVCAGDSTIYRTWIATDTCGNKDTCLQVITYVDTTPPVISCPADTVFNCVMGNAGIATATDNCDSNPSVSFTDDTTSARCPLSITRTWVALDCSGNADTCVQLITVQDIEAPVISCPSDTTFECNAGGNAGGNAGVATATDNCDPNPNITFSDVRTPGSCPGDTVITRTWIAVDTCGNADTCVQTITITDTTPPVITCPADTVFECVMGNAGTATATDVCDPNPSITFTDAVTSARCPLMITRTWVATDCSGNADTCVQFITVQDTIAPVITCPADTVFSCDAGNAGMATATDNCDPNPTITSRDDTTSTVCPLVILRTWYATDTCGNVDSCVQSITVQDTTAPVISCPANVTFECNIGGNPGTATATDNCDSNPGITFSDSVVTGNCDGDSTIHRTWIATDFCGNADTCVQIISYTDTTPPVITCPADTVFECVIGNSGQATATDNCDPNPTITSSDDTTSARCPLMITRTWVATDCSGNADTCVQLIKVQDTLAPVIVCPADTTFECNVGGNSGVATATDNCDPNPTITSSDVITPGSCPQDTVITRTWIAVDTCGNADTCVQTITIQDTTPPVVTCPADTVFECAMGNAGSATATDNCDSNLTITSSDDTTSARCPLMITRTWVATDCSGNADTCAQLITVQDTLAPVISCPSDTVFECSMGNAGTATATDNCVANPTIASSDDTTSARCPLIILRTWTATDTCGNVDSCVQTITVQDTTAPVITCAAGDTVECDAAIVFTAPTATDNCDSVVITMLGTDTTAGPGDGQTTYTRSWVATDSCGNSSDTCSQAIVEEACRNLCTFTIGGWGSGCPGSQTGDMLSTQPGCIRDHYFALVFPSGVTIGDPAGFGGGNPNFYSATWTSSAAVQEFLPDGGTPSCLTNDVTNPNETPAGILASQVLALTLNREYSCAGIFDSVNIGSGCYGSEIIPDTCGKFAGITVDSFLVIANKVVGGKKNALNSWHASISDVNFTATCLNELHHACDPFSLLTIFGSLDSYDSIPSRSTDSAAKVLGDKVLPTEFSLSQNYPNPFNPASKILFGLPEASYVSLEIFNIMGQRVETLVNDQLEAGYHTVQWNASAYSSGVYFYRIKAGAFTETKKMMLLK